MSDSWPCKETTFIVLSYQTGVILHATGRRSGRRILTISAASKPRGGFQVTEFRFIVGELGSQ